MNARLLAPALAGLFFFVSLTRYAWLSYGPPAQHARFECAEARAHLGVIRSGEAGRHAFEIRNAGGQPLEVKASAGCGRCTGLPVATLTIPSGGSGTLPVEINTAGEKAGEHNYRVLLETNDPSYPYVVLLLTGEVRPPD